MVEILLGITAKSKPLPDFPELGLEIKHTHRSLRTPIRIYLRLYCSLSTQNSNPETYLRRTGFINL